MTGGWRSALAGQVETAADSSFWQAYFEANPDVMNDLLVDLHKAAHGAKPPTLDSLWDMLAPRFTNEPIGTAVPALLAERQHSMRWLAHQLRLTRSSLAWALDEERSVSLTAPRDSMARIEAIAKVLRIHPSYFAEWRRLWFMQLLDVAFQAKPNLSAALYPKYAEHEVRSVPVLVNTKESR